MVKRNLLKMVSTLLVIAMITMICNVSFASSSITSANIKASLEKISRTEIFIKGSDSSKMTIGGSSEGAEGVTEIITNSTIGVKVQGEEYTLFNYSIEDNVCTFDAKIEDFYKLMKIDTSKASKEDLDTANYTIVIMAFMYMENLYLATVDSVGQNLSLAYTYFMQKAENMDYTGEGKVDINMINDIFSITMKSDDSNIMKTASLNIYLDKLADLKESAIDDKKTTYKVFLGQLPDSEKENIETEYKIDSINNKVYTGKEIKPSVNIIEKKSGLRSYLENETDYKVTYSNNVNTGKATVTVTGIKFHKGTLTKTFYIVPKKVEGLKTKKQAKTSVTLEWSKNGGNVTGYKVYYYNYDKKAWKYLGKTKSTTYKVEELKAGTTYKFRVRAYKSIDENQYFGAYSTSVKTSTKTKTPKITKLTKGKKKFTVKFNKVSKADGYKIEYSTDKNFNKNTKTEKVSKKSTSKTISKLKSKKKYYVRIRAYRKVDGKKIYSSYSETKSIKTK